MFISNSRLRKSTTAMGRQIFGSGSGMHRRDYCGSTPYVTKYEKTLAIRAERRRAREELRQGIA